MATKAQLQQQPNRFLFIDGLRGLAAIAVVGYHFYVSSPLHEALAKISPRPFCLLLEEGRLGVEIFFVISGFVITYSLRKTFINPQSFRQFAFRVLLRLTPAYWLTILLTVLLNFASNLILFDRTSSIPSLMSIIAHLAYLQSVFGFDQIVPVFWTLCLEVQFYFVFTILLGIVHWLVSKNIYLNYSRILLIVFSPFVLISVALSCQESSLKSFFILDWYMFFTGVIVCWIFEGKINPSWFWAYTGIVASSLIISWDLKPIAALVTGWSIYYAAQHGHLYSWLSFGWLQYLGKISYSLYLIHLVTGMRLINIGYRLIHDSLTLSLLLFVTAFAVSILSAHAMYLFVEKPSLMLSRKFALSNH